MEQILSEIETLLTQLPPGDALLKAGLALGVIYLAKRALRWLRRPRTKLPAPFEIHDPYVIDGDTIAMGNVRIRLFGIDAPESGQRQGRASTRHLKQLIDGGGLRIVPRDVDIYDRIVAQIFKGDDDICRQMVADGYAVASTDYTSLYTAQQARARRKRAGLWRYGAIQNPSSYRRQRG